MRYPGPKAGSDLEPIALLEPRQITALQELLSGTTVKEAAEEADVHRSTVHRWLRRDLAFRAVYNRRLYELQQSAVARVHRMMHTALDQLEEALEEGELSSSETLRFLESAGFLNGHLAEPGPVDVDELLDETSDRLVEQTSYKGAQEWMDLLDDWADQDELPSDGSFRGIRATAKKALQELEQGDVRVEDFESGTDAPPVELMRAFADGASPEALLEWQGVLEELHEPGSDLSGVSAWSFWLTLGQLLAGAEDEVEQSKSSDEAASGTERDEVVDGNGYRGKRYERSD